MPRMPRVLCVHELCPFLLADLEVLGAYEIEGRQGIYFTGLEMSRPHSPFMPGGWWWLPTLDQGTYVLARDTEEDELGSAIAIAGATQAEGTRRGA